MLVIITTMIGSAAVGLMAVGFVVRYRQRGTGPRRAIARRRWHRGSSGRIALGLFGLFLGFWVIGFLQYVRLRVAPANTLRHLRHRQAVDVEVRLSARATTRSPTLYVPAGRPVKLIMTSRDVIHSFYVPDFRIKQDVLPGRYTTLWFEVKEPGVHDILCAEYCGTNHSTMRGEVVALDAADYSRFGSAAASIAPPRRRRTVKSPRLRRRSDRRRR